MRNFLLSLTLFSLLVGTTPLLAECTHPQGDINTDCSVDGLDLGLLLGGWGSPDPGAADINSDGVVDGTDLGLLLGSWGQNCGAECEGEIICPD